MKSDFYYERKKINSYSDYLDFKYFESDRMLLLLILHIMK